MIARATTSLLAAVLWAAASFSAAAHPVICGPREAMLAQVAAPPYEERLVAGGILTGDHRLAIVTANLESGGWTW